MGFISNSSRIPTIIKYKWHSMFLEWWNTTKSLSNIWQHFSCRLDKETAKMCKKFNSHDWLNWLSYLVGSSKSHHKISISCTSKKHCQMVEIIFVVFHHSRNIPWAIVTTDGEGREVLVSRSYFLTCFVIWLWNRGGWGWVGMTTFYLLNHQSGSQKKTFSKLSYIFLIQ